MSKHEIKIDDFGCIPFILMLLVGGLYAVAAAIEHVAQAIKP